MCQARRLTLFLSTQTLNPWCCSLWADFWLRAAVIAVGNTVLYFAMDLSLLYLLQPMWCVKAKVVSFRFYTLTLWRPPLPYRYSCKSILCQTELSCTSSVIFDIGAERQSARMSKITNDGITRSGTGYFYSCTHMPSVCVRGLIQPWRACL